MNKNINPKRVVNCKVLWIIVALSLIYSFETLGGVVEGWENRHGIHILSNYGREYTFVSCELSERYLHQALTGLDWIEGFHQVVVVREGGESMEVGGSLQEEIGLAAVYRVNPDRVSAVIVEPPETVDEMYEILVAFSKGGNSWRERYEFE